MVREHRTPVTLRVTSRSGEREAEDIVVGDHVVELDYATPRERALRVTSPRREQRLVVTEDGAAVMEDGWRRPLWRTGDSPTGAADFGERDGRREWRVDSESCLHVHSEWTLQLDASAPWDQISYLEELVWCDGAERSRTLMQEAGAISQLNTWSPP
ncbi:MAG: hypothetical protein ACJA1R_003162 [Flavobacteriales bacterium]|jgi:hypothetical protein